MEPNPQCHAAPRPPHLASPGRANPAHDGSSGSPSLAGTSRDPSRGTGLRALAERIRSPANLPSVNPGRLLAPLLPLIHSHASTRTFAPAFVPRVLTMRHAPGPGVAEEANRNHPALPASPSEGPTALRHRPRDGGGFRALLPATGQGAGSFEGTTARRRVSGCPARGGPWGQVCRRDDVASPFLGLAPRGSSADTSPPAPDPVPPRSRPLHTGRSEGPARVSGEALAPSRGPGGLHPPAASPKRHPSPDGVRPRTPQPLCVCEPSRPGRQWSTAGGERQCLRPRRGGRGGLCAWPLGDTRRRAAAAPARGLCLPQRTGGLEAPRRHVPGYTGDRRDAERHRRRGLQQSALRGLPAASRPTATGHAQACHPPAHPVPPEGLLEAPVAAEGS